MNIVTRKTVTLYAIMMTIMASAAKPISPATSDSIAVDTTASVKKSNIINRIVDYFKNSNKPARHEGFDFSFLGGPHYSSESKFGIGVVAAGQYYAAPMTDTITRESNLSLSGDITTGNFYQLCVTGNHFSRGNKWRLDYDATFYSFKRKFWGVGFDAAKRFGDYTSFTELYIHGRLDAYYNIGHHIYAGPSAHYNLFKATKVKEPALWGDQRFTTSTVGVGVKLLYDTRDNLTATQRGYMISLSQTVSPRFLGNHYAFSTSKFEVKGFWPAWKGCIIATQARMEMNYGDVPWGMLAQFGGSYHMRGYYEGRFRDKNEWDVTLEFRQHVWRRNGMVLWGGLGSVFDRFSDIQMRKLLPCGGIGYRWEFKKFTNIRLDFGIGRGETGFIFSINEAF